jgi:hypothetical protein
MKVTTSSTYIEERCRKPLDSILVGKPSAAALSNNRCRTSMTVSKAGVKKGHPGVDRGS